MRFSSSSSRCFQSATVAPCLSADISLLGRRWRFSDVNGPCAYWSSIGVRRADRATNVVPDGSVACEDVDLQKTLSRSRSWSSEVISPQSVKLDRVDKLDIYRALRFGRRIPHDRLASGLGISDAPRTGRTMARRHVHIARRADRSASIGLRVALADLHRGIEFPARGAKKKP